MRIAACLILIASTAAAAAADPVKPAQIAEDVLDAQLPQVPRGIDDDAHYRALYTKDTVLLGSRDEPVGETAKDYVQLLPTVGSVQVDHSQIASLVAGGDQNVVWYTSDVSVAFSGAAEGVGEFHGSGTEHVTQVAARDESKAWKVVASLTGEEGGSIWGGAPGDVGASTAAGPLAALLVSPKAIAAALSADPHVFVLGTEKAERAIGPAAAKKLLTSWAKLSLAIEGKVREVETKSYGFVQAHVKWMQGKVPHWMDAILVAVPAPDGAWKVVGVHYANLR